MFKIGDRVILKKPGFFVKGAGIIVSNKGMWNNDDEHKTLGIRYDEYEGYGSDTDFHHLLIKPSTTNAVKAKPSIEDLILIFDPNDILKDLCLK